MITIIIVWQVLLTIAVGLVIWSLIQSKNKMYGWSDHVSKISNDNFDKINEQMSVAFNRFAWIEKTMAHKNPRHSDPEYKIKDELNGTKFNKQ